MSKIQRLLCSVVFQFFVLFALGALYGVVYFVIHLILEQPYQENIRDLSQSSFSGYAILKDPESDEWVLWENDTKFVPTAERRPAPFGLESLVSFTGTLSSYASSAQNLNSIDEQRRQVLLHSIETKSGGIGELPAAYFDSKSSSLSLRFSPHLFRRLETISPHEFRVLAQPLILQAVTWDPHVSSGILFDSLRASSEEDIVNEAVEQTIKRSSEILAGAPDGSRVSMPDSLKAAIKDYFENWELEMVDSLERGVPADTEAETVESTSLENALDTANSALVAELHGVVKSELGSFWLMGRFRWLEIIMWVWFGVFTKGILDLGLTAAGLKNQHYEPREFLRIVGKFIYAPILALGLFFLAQLLEAESEAFEFGRSSPAVLGMALVIGMFPNTAFRIIRDLATRLFRGEIVSSAYKRKVLPAKTKVNIRDLSSLSPDEAITVADLKANIREFTTAPLKNEI